MNLEQIDFLIQPVIQELLATLKITDQNHLQVASKLGKDWSQEQVHALIETAILRQRAQRKFSRASAMLFTRSALEQASGESVSTYRAQRFQAAGLTQVADLCCSIGGDAIPLAAHMGVTGIDLDPVRLKIASYNIEVYDRAAHFIPLEANLEELKPIEQTDAFFFDPARRTDLGKRIYHLAEYRPPVTLINRWLPVVPTGGVKISPGVDYEELPPAETATVEFISVRGEVREAVLWYGALRGESERTATLLPNGDKLHSQPELPDAQVTPPKAWLYEPDGAVIRAHLIKELAVKLNGTQIDSSIALLTTESLELTPFARAFQIIGFFPFQLKRLRRYVREQNIGRVIVKKRGSPIDPQWLEKQLKAKGDNEAILFLTQVSGEPTVIVCQQA
ncbi:MAG: class I SAM-dependent methyltransferase [Anaerolineae bacterium]